MIEPILATLQGMSAWWFLAAMAFLPLLGVPASPLWILTGITFGVWYGLGLIVGGLAINFALAYVISQRWLRKPVSKYFLRKGIRIPEAQPGEYIQLTLAIRLMPAFPMFMQGYLLGLANVPFLTYYIFSFPPQIAYAVGFVLLGDSLFNMKGGGFILAISILIAVTLLVNIVRKRLSLQTSLDRMKQ